MQFGIFKVCLVVVTAIVNHPLLFPNENTTLPATDEQIIQKMKDREESLKAEQMHLEQMFSSTVIKEKGEEEEASEKTEAAADEPSWDFWSALSMVIFLMIEIWRQDFQEGSAQAPSKEEDDLPFLGNNCQGVSLPNKATLAIFYEQYIRLTTHDAVKTREFVEGFADDLLEALRSICNRDKDMEVENSICIGSMYENWRVKKPLTCDLIVTFAPPEPYQFRCQPWISSHSISPDKQGDCGTIQLIGPDNVSKGCVCDRTKLGEDMLCLLHNPTPNKTKVVRDIDLLCSKDTDFLDTIQVMKWFQSAVTIAWGKISHKYDFDLAFSQLDTPGALRVKFRSGKIINFNITPVVQFEDSDLYFISHFPNSPGPHDSNIQWVLSFAVYEKRFLKDIAKKLPVNSCHLSCLQIVSFLHSKQCQITGSSGLTTYHLKTVLLHLLLSRPFLDWDIVMLEERLRDMFVMLEKCLLEKKLNHFMVGNPKLPESVNIPESFHCAEPLNLFRSFFLNRDLYQKTLVMFYEMLKNATVLINEYSLRLPSSSLNK